MLAENDPLRGYFDRVIAEGDTTKIAMLRNIYPLIMAEFGEPFDAEKFKERSISCGYGSRETLNALYPEHQAQQPEGE